MDRRRLQSGGALGLMQQLQGQTPMSGSGATPNPDKGDAVTQPPQATPDDPGSDYIIPARPSVLSAESGMTSQHPLMQLMRRRVDTSGMGPRRLG